ncbi:hypothetical protein B0H13DRAFT_2667108 [Mycena leptocephala]|nr:hypothetical protein B0H13DRAFT_2667108 [Mycena leptocephala]
MHSLDEEPLYIESGSVSRLCLLWVRPVGAAKVFPDVELKKQNVEIGIALPSYSSSCDDGEIPLGWLSPPTETKSFHEFNRIDFLDGRIVGAYGMELLKGYSKADSAVAEQAKVPQDWPEGVGGRVDYIFVTAGEREVIRDDSICLAERLKMHHTNVELVVQEGGVHDNMFIDFFTWEKKLSSLTPKVISQSACQMNTFLKFLASIPFTPLRNCHVPSYWTL